MKTFKRFSAILIAVLMMVAMMAVPASAAEGTTTYTVEISNPVSGHTYTAYQLFTGTLSGDILSNIKWGNAITADGQTALGNDPVAAAGAIKTTGDAETFVSNLIANNYLDKNNGIAASNNKFENLVAGYYAIIDTVADNSLENDNDAYSKYILRVVKNVTISPKASVPTLTKEVSLRERLGYSASVNASFGDTVYFKLVGTMPDHVDDYTTYRYKMEDKIPTGLTFDAATGIMHVYVMNNGQYYALDADDYTVSFDNNLLTVDFGDIKADILSKTTIPAVTEDEILVVYKTTVNSTANIGEAGNANAAVLYFENDPNNEGTDDASLGKTAQAQATVYTYQMTINKVNSDNKAVPGATFLMYRVVGSTTEYVTVDSNGNFAGTTTNKDNASRLVSGTDGTVSVAGITSGVYHLVEEKSPAGYNDLPDEVRFAMDGASAGVYSFSARITHGSAYASVATTPADGLATVTIVNTAGSTLPSTGGIGTTIFYGIGGVLVLGALSLLIVRKRTTAK